MPNPDPSHAAPARHLLASLRFRFDHVCHGAPPGFATFAAGPDVRTPAALVTHLTGLVRSARTLLDGTPSEPPEPRPWDEEAARFRRELADLDRVLARAAAPWTEDVARAWRGPLADALTHVGQLALLRRLAGAPVEPVGYRRAVMPFASDRGDDA